ncbi:MAG: SAM-dependent methyltransferase [Bdellovibrionales bacterium]
MDFVYLAFENFESELSAEIQFKTGRQAVQKGRLFYFSDKHDFVWAQLRLSNCQKIEISSIAKAAAALRSRKRNWASYSYHLHRRTQLIQEQLRAPAAKPLHFGDPLPQQEWGLWWLESETQLVMCESTGSKFPAGELSFEEDRTRPPSRAYLKLWEAFTAHVTPPKPGQLVVDLGCCPGGWTWVLQTLKCQVMSVDKAPLDPRIQGLSGIEFLKKDAFRFDPSSIPTPQWLFSDIICEPRRLYDLVRHWLDEHPHLNCVCTIKYKGTTDFATTELMAQIPGSRLVHLVHNKHEVTWIRQPL